jgi:hypothetical protein
MLRDKSEYYFGNFRHLWVSKYNTLEPVRGSIISANVPN